MQPVLRCEPDSSVQPAPLDRLATPSEAPSQGRAPRDSPGLRIHRRSSRGVLPNSVMLATNGTVTPSFAIAGQTSGILRPTPEPRERAHRRRPRHRPGPPNGGLQSLNRAGIGAGDDHEIPIGLCARTAASILATISPTSTSRFPARWPHFLADS